MLVFSRDENRFINEDSSYECESYVRNELNRKRQTHLKKDYCYGTNPEGDVFPTMPRRFPDGKFLITEIRKVPKSHPDAGYLGEYFIATTATQPLKVWSGDRHHGLREPLEKWETDTGYGFHLCPIEVSRSSWGCGLFRHGPEFKKFLTFLRKELKNGPVPFRVV